jgi:hypothetical protein
MGTCRLLLDHTGDSDNAEIRRIKKATRAIPHRDTSDAVDRALYAYYTGVIPGHDDPAAPIPRHDVLPNRVKERAAN